MNRNRTRSPSALFPSYLGSELFQDNQEIVPRRARKSSKTSPDRHLSIVAEESSAVSDALLPPAAFEEPLSVRTNPAKEIRSGKLQPVIQLNIYAAAAVFLGVWWWVQY